MFQTGGWPLGCCPCPTSTSVGSVPLSLLTSIFTTPPPQLLLQAIKDVADSSAPPPGYEQDSMVSCECLWSEAVGPGTWSEAVGPGTWPG